MKRNYTTTQNANQRVLLIKTTLMICVLLLLSFNSRAQVIYNSGGTITVSSWPVGAERGITIYNNTNVTFQYLPTLILDNISPGNDAKITVQGGSRLNILGGEIKFRKDAYLYLFENAKLQMYSAKLTSFSATDGWVGIVLEKTNGHFDHVPIMDTSGNCTEAQWQGVIKSTSTEMFDRGSFITNAKNGVSSQPTDSIGAGAIVQLNNTSFVNCETGINLLNNFDHDSSVRSASYIMNCDFFRDINYPTTFGGFTGIYMDKCKGVRIGGCFFDDGITVANPTINTRAIGIHSIRSSLSASKSGNMCYVSTSGGDSEDPCPDNTFSNGAISKGNSFNRLDTGVFYELPHSLDKVSIRSSSFTDNQVAVKVTRTNSFVFGYNNVYFNTTAYNNLFGPAFTMKGLDVGEYDGIAVYNNNFDYSDFIAASGISDLHLLP